MFVCNEKVVPLQRQTGKVDKQSIIGLWCNGNTTDSGPVFLGSNPSNPTERAVFNCSFFVVYSSKK